MERNGLIAIIIDDMVEFHAMKNGIDALAKEGLPVDIIVPGDYAERQPLLDETYDEIAKLGYSPVRGIDGAKMYKILLEPNPVGHYFLPETISHEFRIKYKYSLISAKPWPIYLPERSVIYDAILCYTKREAEILGAHTKTFLISPMRYKGFKKDPSRPSGKPVLLYCPTFGEGSSIDTIERAMNGLKEDYYIIAKTHHLTQLRDDERGRIDILERIADEYYGQSADLVGLLQRVDVVLSDNSGSIFEAIYAEVPVAVYHHESLNSLRLEGIDTYQHQLAQRGVLPYTFDADGIGAVLYRAVGNREKQKAEKADFLDAEDVTKAFVDVIKQFMGLDRDSIEYYAMHDIIRDTYARQEERVKRLEEENSFLKEEDIAHREEADRIRRQLEEDILDLLNEKSYRLGRALTAPYRALNKKTGK